MLSFFMIKYGQIPCANSFGEDEALRYEAIKPLRDFVMTNYHVVKIFGDHVLFELNHPAENKEQK